MRIVCWQTILIKYYTYLFSKIGEDVAKFVVCCSHDWPFKGKTLETLIMQHSTGYFPQT